MDKLKIEYVNINRIKPYKKNPRKNEDAIPYVMESIKQFGFKNPVILDKDNVIVAGHTRIESAKRLGITEIPCIYADDLTDEQIKAFRLADNKVAEIAEWDIDLLDTELDDILNIDMSDFGFDLDLEDEEEKEIIEDEVPEVPEEPKAKLGDIYQLGNHRKMSREDGDKFILNIFKNIQKFNKGAYYVCFYRLGLDYIFRALDKLNNQYKALIIWNKGNHTLSNSDYMSKYEPIVYGWFNDHLFYGDRSNFDIWDIQRTQKNDLHPTMKPIALCSKAIENSSKKEDIVLDLFGGSGSTLIASEQLERNCYTMELDPKYVDVIIERWENFTGKKAVKIN